MKQRKQRWFHCIWLNFHCLYQFTNLDDGRDEEEVRSELYYRKCQGSPYIACDITRCSYEVFLKNFWLALFKRRRKRKSFPFFPHPILYKSLAMLPFILGSKVCNFYLPPKYLNLQFTVRLITVPSMASVPVWHESCSSPQWKGKCLHFHPLHLLLHLVAEVVVEQGLTWEALEEVNLSENGMLWTKQEKVN